MHMRAIYIYLLLRSIYYELIEYTSVVSFSSGTLSSMAQFQVDCSLALLLFLISSFL
jgi:hypothetical protein